jgi:hypothetical protein
MIPDYVESNYAATRPRDRRYSDAAQGYMLKSLVTNVDVQP